MFGVSTELLRVEGEVLTPVSVDVPVHVAPLELSDSCQLVVPVNVVCVNVPDPCSEVVTVPSTSLDDQDALLPFSWTVVM